MSDAAEQDEVERFRALAEHNFRQLRHCARCRRLLVLGKSVRRVYDLPAGLTLVKLCDQCDVETPAGGTEEAALRARLERFQ